MRAVNTAVPGMSARSAKSAAKRPGYARKETCRQTLMVLQHKNFLRETSEFRSHAAYIAVR